jgi:cystathionine beta-lyase/cystathionine gamma-synthase
LNLIAIATSLGGVETVAELPYDLDSDPDTTDVAEANLRRGFVRMSVGLEDLDDLLGDIYRALA